MITLAYSSSFFCRLYIPLQAYGGFHLGVSGRRPECLQPTSEMIVPLPLNLSEAMVAAQSECRRLRRQGAAMSGALPCLAGEEKPEVAAPAPAPAPLLGIVSDRESGTSRHRLRPSSRLQDAHEDKLVTQRLVQKVRPRLTAAAEAGLQCLALVSTQKSGYCAGPCILSYAE